MEKMLTRAQFERVKYVQFSAEYSPEYLDDEVEELEDEPYIEYCSFIRRIRLDKWAYIATINEEYCPVCKKIREAYCHCGYTSRWKFTDTDTAYRLYRMQWTFLNKYQFDTKDPSNAYQYSQTFESFADNGKSLNKMIQEYVEDEFDDEEFD